MAQLEELDLVEDAACLVDDEGRPRPPTVHSYSDPTPTRRESLKDSHSYYNHCNHSALETSSGESRDIITESPLPLFSHPQNGHLRVPASKSARQSYSTFTESPVSSRPNSPFGSNRLGVPSSATSASIFTVDTQLDRTNSETRRRPSVFSRLKSSVSTSGSGPTASNRRSSIQPSDFQLPPEQPEKHFIDSVGMVIPGVVNRSQCVHPLAHFVSNWRLCVPIEYTTALADHGITYTDYCCLIAALEDFLDGIPDEPKRKTPPKNRWWAPKSEQNEDSKDSGDDAALQKVVFNDFVMDSAEQFKRTKFYAANLNKLLADISKNWQARRVPVMVCVGSFSIFAPNRISESHIQILHVSLGSSTPPQHAADRRACQQLLPFVDPFAEDLSVCLRPVVNRRSTSPHSPTSTAANGAPYHYQTQGQMKDRTKPWPLWPNAIPSHKKDMITDHSDRYGVDPYFRAYMRASVNARTKSSSYTKYMIEREDNPFINRRLEYATTTAKKSLPKGIFGGTGGEEALPVNTNRNNYEHNRRLECRKTVEHGSRLRIIRFGFQHPIYPPHTPEMDELGLTKEKYRTIIARIDDIRRNNYTKSSKGHSEKDFMPWLRHLRKRSADDALTKVSEYVRQINAQQRRIVWTIEKIPGVYEKGFGRKGKEWEISAWSGEDPLELLIQLERWGIIEKRLNIDDDE